MMFLRTSGSSDPANTCASWMARFCRCVRAGSVSLPPKRPVTSASAIPYFRATSRAASVSICLFSASVIGTSWPSGPRLYITPPISDIPSCSLSRVSACACSLVSIVRVRSDIAVMPVSRARWRSSACWPKRLVCIVASARACWPAKSPMRPPPIEDADNPRRASSSFRRCCSAPYSAFRLASCAALRRSNSASV